MIEPAVPTSKPPPKRETDGTGEKIAAKRKTAPRITPASNIRLLGKVRLPETNLLIIQNMKDVIMLTAKSIPFDNPKEKLVKGIKKKGNKKIPARYTKKEI
jgi:hypothetical protein